MLFIDGKAHYLTFNLVLRMQMYNSILPILIAFYFRFLERAILKEDADAQSCRIVLILVAEDREYLIFQRKCKSLVQADLILLITFFITILKHVMRDELLLVHIVVGKDVAVNNEHEVLVKEELMIWLMHIPVLHALQIGYHLLAHVSCHQGVIESSSLLQIERNDHPMTLHLLVVPLQDDLIEVHLDLRVRKLLVCFCA